MAPLKSRCYEIRFRGSLGPHRSTPDSSPRASQLTCLRKSTRQAAYGFSLFVQCLLLAHVHQPPVGTVALIDSRFGNSALHMGHAGKSTRAMTSAKGGSKWRGKAGPESPEDSGHYLVTVSSFSGSDRQWGNKKVPSKDWMGDSVPERTKSVLRCHCIVMVVGWRLLPSLDPESRVAMRCHWQPSYSFASSLFVLLLRVFTLRLDYRMMHFGWSIEGEWLQ
ncbi:hypothetical protein EI94DRAFT_1701236 [Lactarius quietus]|nr:hypothetical protein EI94DRAFT_1701236 [Lactarius quietus]